MTLETRELDSSYSQRKFVYELTANNNFSSCKQKLLFCCYIIPVLCFPFCLCIFCISLASLNYPGFWIRTYLKKNLKDFQSILCRINKWNLFLSTIVLLFDVLNILILHFVLFFSIFSQKEKFYVKRKNNSQSSCMIFFHILCRMDIFFKRLIINQSDITMNMSNT